jgi:hypothetical protein
MELSDISLLRGAVLTLSHIRTTVRTFDWLGAGVSTYALAHFRGGGNSTGTAPTVVPCVCDEIFFTSGDSSFTAYQQLLHTSLSRTATRDHRTDLKGTTLVA